MSEKVNIVELYRLCSSISKQLIKEAQQSKDGMTVSENVLESLRESFKQIVEFEKMYLIMAQDSFYGALLMSVETDIDFKIKGPVDIDVSGEPFLLKINPLYCADYKFPEFTGLIVSELLKVVYDHPSIFAELNGEKSEENHQDLEKASSAQTSSLVQNDIRLENSNNGGLRLPHNAYTTSSLNDDVSVTPRLNESLEYYYNVLKKFKKKDQGGQQGANQQFKSSSFSSGQSGSQEQDSQGDQQQNQSPVEGKDMKGNQISTPQNGQGDQVHDWENQGNSDDLHDKAKALVSEVFNNLPEDKRGTIPGSILSQIKALLEPPQINWKKRLRQMLGTVPVPYRKTRTRLNRRQPYRSDLSGRLPKRVVDIVVVFDTSGSMSDKCLEYCFTEVLNIIKDYEGTKITVVECDAEIGKVYQCRSIRDFQTKITGRGGTSFIPAIQFINGESPYNKKYPGLAGSFRHGLMVYFTDGFGDAEIPQPKTYRNMWVVLDDVKNLSLKEPYGEVVSLSTDKDYKRYMQK